MFPTPRWSARAWCVSFALVVSCLACDETAKSTAFVGAGGERASLEGSAGADLNEDAAGAPTGVDDSSYAGNIGEEECRPGQTRCHGVLGFQRCTPEATWGESQTCAGYSENGTSSYCITTDGGDGPWAACVDPACWWWLESGLEHEARGAGVCTGENELRPCNAGGILLAPERCDGFCRTVGEIDGRALGYCETTCQEGERECLGGSLYRECDAGTWSTRVVACADGVACQPLGHVASSDIKCGGACDPGTSRCNAAGDAVEMCDERGGWQAPTRCLLGRCFRSGPQAQCQMECKPGERACAFDGADTERACTDAGLWGEATQCPAGERCRVGTRSAFGCLACVSADLPGGNGWGVADSFCDAGGVVECGVEAPTGCADGQNCVEIHSAAASLAYCE
jgi:hypothetical protein